ncbi:MAG: serine/threonine-protein kinase [Planctomycetota bacterium]
MSENLDTRLFDLAAAIEGELDLDATIDFAALAQRFDVPPDDVRRVVTALRAVQQALGEDLDARTELAPPDLPADYELGAELGRGGMGIVYRAHQRSLDRDVAVKVLRPGDLAFGPAIARFEREAKNLARLRHRHIVSVHEVGRANGHVYFTMDLVEGKSLQRAIADREMTATRAVKLVRQICSAMVYAHQKGVVHRDLKPANVLVDENDDAFVCDFGLARDLGDGCDATLSGQLVGTPAYMSPEQALGDKARVGEASDVYALGAILYECLAGQPPFHGLPLAKLMAAVVADEPVALRKRNPRVPRDLAVICGKAMQKRIEDRYATVQALAEDLERFAIGKEILARPRPWFVRGARFVRRHRGAVVAAALPVVAAVAAMWWLVVPELLQRHQRELGDRLYAEGNLDGARYAYGEAGLVLPKSATDPDARCTRFADCLVDEAGRLLAAGQADRAKELATAAKDLLPDAHDLRNFGYLAEAQITERHDAWYVACKADALGTGRVDTAFGLDVLTPRLRADLTGSRPEAAALLAGMLVNGPDGLLAPLEDARSPWITTLLRMRANLPEARRAWLDRLCRANSAMELEYHDADFEQALVALVRDRGLDAEARQDAAALLHRFGRFPFLRNRAHPSPDGRPNSFVSDPFVVTDEDLDELVARWDSLRGLDRITAYDRRIGFVLETIARPAPAIEGVPQSVTDSVLRSWLERHTGHHGTDVAAWWGHHRDEDPRARLLGALKWEVRPADLTPALLLREFHGPAARSSAYAQGWIHELLTLTVADDVRVPFLSPRTGDLVVRWERALHAIPGDGYTLRLATLGFVGGAPTPRILWQKELPIGIDETVRWNERMTPDLGGLGYEIEFLRNRVQLSSSTLAVLGQAKLEWTNDGVRGRIDNCQTTLVLAGASGQYRGDHHLHPGRVTVAGGSWFEGKGGQWHVDAITLATVVPAAAPTTPWTTADWQQALGATIEGLAKAGEAPVLNALPIVVAADFLPLGPHREALLAIDALASTSPFGAGLNCVEERRRARLLAGDPTALDLPATPAFAEAADAPAFPGRTSFLVRLALTTDVPALRDHAFAQLQETELPPAFARTLAAAIAAGAPAPTWLAERVRDTPGRFAAFVQANQARLAGLLLLGLIAFAALIVTIRHRRPFAAGLLYWSSLWLGHCSLVVGDTELLQPPPFFAMTIVAAWVGCWRIVPGFLWWFTPLWWSASAVVLLFGGLGRAESGFFYGVTFALYYCIKWQLWRAHRAELDARWDRMRKGVPRVRA